MIATKSAAKPLSKCDFPTTRAPPAYGPWLATGAGVIVALLTPVVEVAAFTPDGLVVTVVMEVLVAVGEPDDKVPVTDVPVDEAMLAAVLEAVSELVPEVVLKAVPEASPDEPVALTDELEGVVDPPTMAPPRLVVTVATDVDVTRVVAVVAAVALSEPPKPLVIPVVELAAEGLAVDKYDVNIWVAVARVVDVGGPGRTTTVTP